MRHLITIERIKPGKWKIPDVMINNVYNDIHQKLLGEKFESVLYDGTNDDLILETDGDHTDVVQNICNAVGQKYDYNLRLH